MQTLFFLILIVVLGYTSFILGEQIYHRVATKYNKFIAKSAGIATTCIILLILMIQIFAISFLFWTSLCFIALCSTIILKYKNYLPAKINSFLSDRIVFISFFIISFILMICAIITGVPNSHQNNSTLSDNKPSTLLNSNHEITQPQPQPQINTTSPYDLSCKVIGVTDGDTITCLKDKQQIKVRLHQIDAPESKQDFGSAAKAALSGYIFGKTVDLKTDGTDKYKRTIAEIYFENENINKKMVANGYAWAYREYLKDSEYQTLEQNARSQSLGLWSQPNPIYPSEFRNPAKPNTTTESTRPKPSNSNNGFQCEGKRFCKEMNSCAEAQFYLKQCGVSRLDRDNDGVACESLC